MPQTQEDVLLAHQADAPALVGYVNNNGQGDAAAPRVHLETRFNF